MKTNTAVRCLIAFIIFLLLLVNVYVVKSFSVFGEPIIFSISLASELLLFCLFVFYVLKAFKRPLLVLVSIASSAWKGILTNSSVKKLKKSRSPIFEWFADRFNIKNPAGLILTLGLVTSLFFLINFLRVLVAFWTSNQLNGVDIRINNLMPLIRTPLQTEFFGFITTMAGTAAIVLLVSLCVIILVANKQRLAALFFLSILFIEEGTAFVVKNLVARERPPQLISLINEDSYSFPSGHSLRVTVIYGLLAYFLIKSFKSSIARFFIIFSYVLLVTLVAISRVYLGVHYPTDVIASILLGASLLTLVVTIIEIIVRYKISSYSIKSFVNQRLLVVPACVLVFAWIAAPSLININKPTSRQEKVLSINETTANQLPLYSETLTGKTMEPISFIFVGSKQQIEQIFEEHGWLKADPPTISNTIKAYSVSFQGGKYPTAPVTPSFLNLKPQNLAFQKSTAANTLRQRHHIRLWQTDFVTPNGQNVWVATASYDEGIEFAGPAKIPTHRIDPNIDAERDFIVYSLNLNNIEYIQLLKPQAGQNSVGDIFFTDGRVVLVKL